MSDEGDRSPPPPSGEPPAAVPPSPDPDPSQETATDQRSADDDSWSTRGTPGGQRPQATPETPAPNQENFDSWARQSDREAASEREFHSFGVRPDRRRMYSRVTAEGSRSFAAGGNIHVHEAAGQSGATTGAFAPDWVAASMRAYIRSPSCGAAESTIRAHGLVLLTGADGSGRFCTAVHLAGELCGADNVVSIDLDAKSSFSTAFDRSDVLREKHAHIVAVSSDQPITRQSLAVVAGKVRAARGHLIVIGQPDRMVDPNLLPYAVFHESPPAEDLLRHFLGARLIQDDALCVGSCDVCSKSCARPFIERCLDDEAVRKHLIVGPLAGELDDLAGRLLTAQYRGEPLASAVGLTYSRIRGIAETVLGKPTPNPVKPSETRQLLHTLSFRVAYATLNESPLTVIFSAARMLYEELSAEYRPSQSVLTTPPFDGKVNDLLADLMVVRENTPDEDGDPRPRLIDPRLTTAMLDVLWNKYDRLRAPLMRWTFQLGRHNLEAVRRRAASVCGQFARWDTHDAYHGLIRPWALADGWATRHTAAFAMANLAVDPAHTSWVRRQVADWIGAGTKFNDSAARSYAEIHDCPFAEDVLPNLKVVAAKPELTASFAVPKAVAALAEQQPDSLITIVAALAGWTESPVRGQMVQAARSVLFMSTDRAPEPDDQWPRLLRVADNDKQTWIHLRDLWCVAMSEATTSNHGWAALLAWLLQADGVPVLEDTMVAFSGELLRIPQLRARAAFYTRRWRQDHGQVAILRRLPPKDRGL